MNFLIVPSSLRTVPAHSAPCTSPSIPQPCVCVCVSHSVLSNSLRSHGLEPTRLLCPWDSPGKNWSGLPFLSFSKKADESV